MAWRRCSPTELLLRGVQLSLLVAWLVLTGHKIAYFLSEPTALRSRMDSEFPPPHVTIFPALSLPVGVFNIVKFGTSEQQDALFANYTLDEFITMYSMPMVNNAKNLAALAAQGGNSTASPNSVAWRVTRRCDGTLGATMTPTESSEFYLSPPRNTAFKIPHPSIPSYVVVLHGDRDFFRPDPSLHAILPIKNEPSHPIIKVAVDRDEKLNLRRLPCEPDPNYSVAACERRCYMDRLGCNMEKDETNNKPLCMASNYSLLLDECIEFYSYTANSPAPVSSCDCLTPCVQDRISYSTLMETRNGNENIMFLSFSMNRLRRTMMTVLTFDLEDLMAYMGGYLGLLLGSSILSMLVTGSQLAGRVARSHVRRAGRQEAEMEEGVEAAQRFIRNESALFDIWSTPREQCPRSQPHGLQSLTDLRSNTAKSSRNSLQL